MQESKGLNAAAVRVKGAQARSRVKRFAAAQCGLGFSWREAESCWRNSNAGKGRRQVEGRTGRQKGSQLCGWRSTAGGFYSNNRELVTEYP